VVHWVKGRAYFTRGDYPKAIEALAESVRVRPNVWFSQAWLTAAYALANRNAEAQQSRKTFAPTLIPRFGLDGITKIYEEEQYKNETLKKASDQLVKGLKMAGWPP
jgi:hypothetical protein